jgi:processive 1,2-diacylglycerol beta-glucosyltransferase
MRTAILSFALGTGHKRVGDIISQQLVALGHRCDHRPLEQWVPWEYDLLFRRGYLFLALRMPSIWDAMYSSPRFTKRGALAFPVMRGRVVRRFASSGLADYDLVVATQYNAMEVAADYKKAIGKPLKLAVIITDYDIYPLWARPEVDLYLVPHEDLKARLASRGVAPERIVTTGLPVSSDFESERDGSAARAALGLEAKKATVMVFGGGGGFGPMEETVEACLRIAGWQIIVVCGNNSRLQRRLVGMARSHPERLRVLGYRRDIPDLMAASDLLVTKGGGISLTEALYSGIRTVVVPGLPGQEHANIDFFEKLGWVRVCQRLKDLPAFLPRVIECERLRPPLPPHSCRAAAAALDDLARAAVTA